MCSQAASSEEASSRRTPLLSASQRTLRVDSAHTGTKNHQQQQPRPQALQVEPPIKSAGLEASLKVLQNANALFNSASGHKTRRSKNSIHCACARSKVQIGKRYHPWHEWPVTLQ
jgi:hypothetical protein